MKKLTIAVLFGGMSAEYPVSLQSAHAVITHLDAQKYNVLPVGITREGKWLRYLGPPARIKDDCWHAPAHCVPAYISPCRETGGLVECRDGAATVTRLDAAFPVLHGPFGEDGTVQGLLELTGIPIVGCGTLSSALCLDKAAAHRLVEGAGIAVPRWAAFEKDAHPDAIGRAAKTLGWPVFVKPVKGGSSFGVSRVCSPAQLARAVEKARLYGPLIAVEEAIDGFEVGCAVLGNCKLFFGRPDEIELADGFFDFEEKYNLITSKIHVPARIGEAGARRIQAAAERVYRVLGCRVFARVDFFLRPNGGIVFNEVNTIPGFTAHSRYPAMMQAAGLGFGPLLDKLVETALSPSAASRWSLAVSQKGGTPKERAI